MVSQPAPIRILMLDDEPFMLKLLGRMLNNLGHPDTVACDNGLAALDRVAHAQTCPDLILLDLNMPDMDGVEFVRHLGDHGYRGALILVSGEDARVLESVEKLVRAHRMTVLGHLGKPVTPAALAGLIDTWRRPELASGHMTDTPARSPYGAEELRIAIANGEMVNYYQPKVAVATGAVVGVETLVRWRHRDHGLVLPDQFIGIAEQHGLIDALTHAVLGAALAQARHWQDAGHGLRVAVNLSMESLHSLDILACVVALTETAGVRPQDLVLEVTESRLMTDQRIPLEILTRLHLKRFRLSIDDFGTGNSSLAQLRDIPFDELKIDQSFVHGAWDHDTQRVMFDASLGLARQLRMESVAEGVEDRADWDFLVGRGCDLAQGYFIARPMPAEAITDWLREWETRRCVLIADDVGR